MRLFEALHGHRCVGHSAGSAVLELPDEVFEVVGKLSAAQVAVGAFFLETLVDDVGELFGNVETGGEAPFFGAEVVLQAGPEVGRGDGRGTDEGLPHDHA